MPGETYDEVHIVSDLHWGGPPGGEIFAGAGAMARWIESLARASKERKIALVLGGDIVDFIAAPNAGYFNPDSAISVLDAALAGIEPVVDALRDLLDEPNARLVLLRGNHDVELALPRVGAHLADRLSHGKPARRERIDGTRLERADGLTCEVGGKLVHVVHGNAQDENNHVDQGPLDRVIEAMNKRDEVRADPTRSAREIAEVDRAYGKALRAWTPNFGTRLVVDVLNFIKGRRPFIDLLKPESPAALVSLVLALNPLNITAALPLLPGAAPLAAPALAALRTRGLLHGASGAPGDVPAVPVALPHTAGARIDQVLVDLERGVQPLDLVSDPAGDALLAFPGRLARAIFSADRDAALRDGMREWLETQATFDQPKEMAKDDLEIDRVHRSDFDFLVAGHTHIARCARRRGEGAGGWYLNTGTWIRLVRLHPEDVTDEARWTLVRRVLEAPSMAALDALGDIVRSPRNVVKIAGEAGGTVAYLGSVRDDGSVEPIADTSAGAGT